MIRFLKCILPVFLLLIGITTKAQKDTCNCYQNLLQLISNTAADYAGYLPKTDVGQKATYLALKNDLLHQAQSITQPRTCFDLIKTYVHFFSDKHFVAYYYNPADPDSIVLPMPKLALLPKKADEDLPAASVWMLPDSSRKVLLLRQPDGSYKALKMASGTDNFPEGFVYFSMKRSGKLWLVEEADNNKSGHTPARLMNHLLQIGSSAMWAMQQPEAPTKEEEAQWRSWSKKNQGLHFALLNKNTAYLRIGSFANNEDAIAQLIAANDSVIRHTPYLIIDIRGNMGGSTGWVSLLPYIMTQPIIQHPSLLRVSAFNVKNKLPELQPFATGPIPEEYAKYFPDSTIRWYKKAYNELPSTQAPYYALPAVNFPLDSMTRYPQKVALMVDERCGSSAEYFLHLSRQSGKTKSYGAPTWGMMDYEGASVLSPMPCQFFRIATPPAQSSWTNTHPIDQTGMQPDMVLQMPYAMWLQEVLRLLPAQ
jgi:hypothetical protein